MAMTSDFSVHSLVPTVPAGPKKQVEQTEASKPVQTASEVPVDEPQVNEPRPGQQPEKGQLAQAVDDLNSLVQDLQRQVRFSLDDNSGEMIVKVVDRQTDDVIRQIPAESLLQLRERLEEATGAIFKGRA